MKLQKILDVLKDEISRMPNAYYTKTRVPLRFLTEEHQERYEVLCVLHSILQSMGQRRWDNLQRREAVKLITGQTVKK